MEDWYYLDPDNRKDEPNGLHCCRCMRKLSETQSFESFYSVEVHPEYPWVRKNPLGNKLVGSRCWKLIEKEGLVDKPETEIITL